MAAYRKRNGNGGNEKTKKARAIAENGGGANKISAAHQHGEK
jgi:hypothetical protein